MAEQPYYNPDMLIEDVENELEDDGALLAVLRARFKRAERYWAER